MKPNLRWHHPYQKKDVSFWFIKLVLSCQKRCRLSSRTRKGIYNWRRPYCSINLALKELKNVIMDWKWLKNESFDWTLVAFNASTKSGKAFVGGKFGQPFSQVRSDKVEKPALTFTSSRKLSLATLIWHGSCTSALYRWHWCPNDWQLDQIWT